MEQVKKTSAKTLGQRITRNNRSGKFMVKKGAHVSKATYMVGTIYQRKSSAATKAAVKQTRQSPKVARDTKAAENISANANITAILDRADRALAISAPALREAKKSLAAMQNIIVNTA